MHLTDAFIQNDLQSIQFNKTNVLFLISLIFFNNKYHCIIFGLSSWDIIPSYFIGKEKNTQFGIWK